MASIEQRVLRQDDAEGSFVKDCGEDSRYAAAYTVRPLFEKLHNTAKHMNLPTVV